VLCPLVRKVHDCADIDAAICDRETRLHCEARASSWPSRIVSIKWAGT